MQRLLYSIFISFFLILSCAKSKPKDIISESKMSEVLTQVSIVDGYLNILPSDSAVKVMPVLYDKIFEKYGLDSAKFVRNLEYYFADPNLTDKVYLRVAKKLNDYDRIINTEDSVRQAFVQDSINRHFYYQRVYDRQLATRHYNSSDTGFINYYTFNRRALQESSLDFLNYFMNLSQPDLSILSRRDSVKVGGANNLKYLLIYKDTTSQSDNIEKPYKLNSERFLSKMGINLSHTAIVPVPTNHTEVILDRGSQLQEAPSREEPQPTEEFIDTSNHTNLQLREDKQINDRMVKPVRRRGAPQ